MSELTLGRPLSILVERAGAVGSAEFTTALAAVDGSWGTELHAIEGGGWLVLCGPGLYVNRAVAVGIESPISESAIEFVVARSRALGVRPAIEVSGASHPETATVLAAHGFAHVPDSDIAVMARSTADLDPVPVPGIDVEAVEPHGVHRLEDWMETSALGWGHDNAEARRAADVFARAAHSRPSEVLLLALDGDDRRPLGCAAFSIADGIANLGGMSTVPAERGRGVQSALIRHRLRLAADAGCELAMSTAAVGSASERNILRHGFRRLHVTEQWSPRDVR